MGDCFQDFPKMVGDYGVMSLERVGDYFTERLRMVGDSVRCDPEKGGGTRAYRVAI